MRTGVKKIQFIKHEDLLNHNDPLIASSPVVNQVEVFEFKPGKEFITMDVNSLYSSLIVQDLSKEVTMFNFTLRCRIDNKDSYLDIIGEYQAHKLLMLVTTIEDEIFQLGTSYAPVYMSTNIQTSDLSGNYSGTDVQVEFSFPIIHKIITP